MSQRFYSFVNTNGSIVILNEEHISSGEMIDESTENYCNPKPPYCKVSMNNGTVFDIDLKSFNRWLGTHP